MIGRSYYALFFGSEQFGGEEFELGDSFPKRSLNQATHERSRSSSDTSLNYLPSSENRSLTQSKPYYVFLDMYNMVHLLNKRSRVEFQTSQLRVSL